MRPLEVVRCTNANVTRLASIFANITARWAKNTYFSPAVTLVKNQPGDEAKGRQELTRHDREPPQWPYSRGHSEGVVAEANEANEVPCNY